MKNRSKNKSYTEPRGRRTIGSKTAVDLPKSKQQGPRGKKNAYFLFDGEVREEVRGYLEGKCRGREEDVSGKMVRDEISNRYWKLPQKEFDKYQKMADDDKGRYEKQLSDWLEKGYWIDEETEEKEYPTKKKKKSMSKRKIKKRDKKIMIDSDDEEDRSISSSIPQ